MSKKSNLPTTREVFKRQLENEQKELGRRSKIRDAMVEKYATPIFAFNYFPSQAECKQRLGLANAEINKANERNGTAKSFNILKGDKLAFCEPELKALYKKMEQFDKQ